MSWKCTELSLYGYTLIALYHITLICYLFLSNTLFTCTQSLMDLIQDFIDSYEHCKLGYTLGLDTLCFPIPLCSPVMPIMLLKLTNHSQIMLKNFLVHRPKYLIFYSMLFHRVCGTCVVRSCSNECLPYIIGCTTKHLALCMRML